MNRKVITLLLAIAMVFALVIPANAAGPEVINVGSDAQFSTALQYAVDDPDRAVDIHITATVTSPNATITVPENTFLYIDKGATFNINGGKREVVNYGVIFINGTLNHSNNITNMDKAQVILGASGTVKGNQKFVTGGEVVDTRGNREEDKHDHQPGEMVTTIEPTCTALGKCEINCTVCGELIKSEEIDRRGHEYVQTGYKNATCEENGYVRYECIHHDNSNTLVINATGHKPGERTVTKEVAYGIDGAWEICCLTCGKVIESGSIPAIGKGYNFSVYLKHTYDGEVKAGEIYFLDVMLAGNLNYTQVDTVIAYDGALFEYVGKVQLAAITTDTKSVGAGSLAAQSIPAGNLTGGASCAQPVIVERLLFRAKSNLSASVDFSIASATVYPAASRGIDGVTTDLGNPVSVTVQK